MSISIAALTVLSAAYDVDLHIEAAGAEPVEAHLVDVDTGSLPAMYLPTEDGGYIVHVDVVVVGEDKARFDVEIVQQRASRFGRIESEVVSRPRITSLIGQPALLRQGGRAPLPDGGFEEVESISVECTLRE